jgi:hypothetical protein
MKTFLLALFATALLHCQAAEANSIIGDWQPDEVLSQFGPSVTAYLFTTNGTFTLLDVL